MQMMEIVFQLKEINQSSNERFEGELDITLMNMKVVEARYVLTQTENKKEKRVYHFDVTGVATDFKFVLELREDASVYLFVSKTGPSIRPSEIDIVACRLEHTVMEETIDGGEEYVLSIYFYFVFLVFFFYFFYLKSIFE